jgi:hypothetical protein
MTAANAPSPRFLVGVMYCIENEFEECIASIHAQEGVDLEVFVIRDKPNKEAHDELYQTFMERAGDFDYFVKVDADMVIKSHDFLSRVAQRMADSPSLIILTMALQDGILGVNVLGMHCYRSTMRWERRKSDLFTDHEDRPPESTRVDWDTYARDITHCGNPSPFQAFHYGLHRGVKLSALIRDCQGKRYSRGMHWSYVNRMRWRAILLGKHSVLYAALGAELALGGAFDSTHIPYQNTHARDVFRGIESRRRSKLRLSLLGMILQNRLRSPSLIWEEARSAFMRWNLDRKVASLVGRKRTSK